MVAKYSFVIPAFEAITYTRAYGFVVASHAIQRLAS